MNLRRLHRCMGVFVYEFTLFTPVRRGKFMPPYAIYRRIQGIFFAFAPKIFLYGVNFCLNI